MGEQRANKCECGGGRGPTAKASERASGRREKGGKGGARADGNANCADVHVHIHEDEGAKC